MGIVIIALIEHAKYQPLAVITPALLRRASASRHCIPRIHAALDEAQRRIYIRVARLWHLWSGRR